MVNDFFWISFSFEITRDIRSPLRFQRILSREPQNKNKTLKKNRLRSYFQGSKTRPSASGLAKYERASP